jgi:hypothetical protein
MAGYRSSGSSPTPRQCRCHNIEDGRVEVSTGAQGRPAGAQHRTTGPGLSNRTSLRTLPTARSAPDELQGRARALHRPGHRNRPWRHHHRRTLPRRWGRHRSHLSTIDARPAACGRSNKGPANARHGRPAYPTGSRCPPCASGAIRSLSPTRGRGSSAHCRALPLPGAARAVRAGGTGAPGQPAAPGRPAP